MKHWFNKDKTIRLYNEDCINILDRMIENNIKINGVITSPPL